MIFEDFKKIVESCHLNFLIGSGVSKPFLEILSNIENLLNQLSNDSELSENERVLLETSIKYHYLQKSIKGNLLIGKISHNKDLKKTEKNYTDLIRALNTILAKRRNNLVSKQVNIFTSNMDLFLEHTVESNLFAYNDGFFGRINPTYGTENYHSVITKTSTHYEYQSDIPLFNIFKLHGSVTWKIEGSKITYDGGLGILEKVSNIIFDEKDLISLEKEVRGYKVIRPYDELKSDLKNSQLSEFDKHNEFLSHYDDLVMINPTKQKFETTTRDLTFYELLRMYSNHLERENSVLFVIGFSFADEHIREITKRVANSNPTLLIVIFAYNSIAKKSIESFIGQRPNVKYIFNEEDKINYSLDIINENYFGKLSKKLDVNEDDISKPKDLKVNTKIAKILRAIKRKKTDE